MLYYSVDDTGIFGKKEIRVLLSEVEPRSFQLLVRMFYLRATGDSWELRPLKSVYSRNVLLGLECQCVAYARWNKCDGLC